MHLSYWTTIWEKFILVSLAVIMLWRLNWRTQKCHGNEASCIYWSEYGRRKNLLYWYGKNAATDGIANLVNCGTYVKHETIKICIISFELTFGISTKALGKHYEVSKLSNERFLLALLPTSVGLYWLFCCCGRFVCVDWVYWSIVCLNRFVSLSRDCLISEHTT